VRRLLAFLFVTGPVVLLAVGVFSLDRSVDYLGTDAVACRSRGATTTCDNAPKSAAELDVLLTGHSDVANVRSEALLWLARACLAGFAVAVAALVVIVVTRWVRAGLGRPGVRSSAAGPNPGAGGEVTGM
jgi:hypothetical protein